MIEVQDIFNQYGDQYCQTHKLSLVQHKAMYAIKNCRTAKLGGHIDSCPQCNHTQISYNSCRNRHCPKCQTLNKERWIENQKINLLNVKYFHVVFTLPQELNPIIYQNQKLLYNLMFKVVSETLQELGLDKKYLGAKLGFTCVMHTWGQNLMYHPHIHCIIPAGGLNSMNKWVHSRKKFFLPVKVLSKKFRGKFLAQLKTKQPSFRGKQFYLQDPVNFKKLLDMCYQKEWVVYCKPPFQNASCVVEYLGRYTHRVALSNNRITKLQDGQVSFKWRDYRDCKKEKVMTLSAEEFIRRFLTHILPQGFMKIRHYGFLSSRGKQAKLPLCKKLTHTKIEDKAKASTEDLLRKILGRSPSLCPCCGYDKLHHYGLSPPITPN